MPVAVSEPPAADPGGPTADTPLIEPGPAATPAAAVHWGPFCCLLVPAALAGYGTWFGSPGSWALGLAAVTAACRLLLRRREHASTGSAVPAPPHSCARESEGARRGGR
ncbi:hypothetical protein [Streptomyces fulvorobeus]|uniref:Uncharacterized protein n=1 Tax=Streptomyces fulvorobeus TaxID=284028 RepID=A0A7Y9HAL1_9ACTN|nr:hypothetical protein [Streptomyces fulvorobeus]NYE40982.1 hypothetical protein [Streptomyces fulvorobeus]